MLIASLTNKTDYKKMKIKNKTKTLQIILVIALIILIIPSLVKIVSGNPSYVGYESYYHIRMTDQFREQGMQIKESLTNNPYSFNLFHAVMSIFPSSEIIIRFAPIILGLLSLVITFSLFSKFDVSNEDNIFSLIVLILSPVFIYTFSTFTPESLAFFLLVLGIFLYVNNNYFSIPVFAGLILTNFLFGVAVLLILITYSLVKHKFDVNFYLNIFAIILTASIAIFLLKLSVIVQLAPILPSINNLFVSFSAIKGYSVFILILAIIGLQISWKRSLSQTIIYSLITLTFVFSVLYPSLRILVSVVLSIYAGIAISKFVKEPWNVKKLKGITLLLIICSLIFSSAVFLKAEISEINPDKIDAVNYLTATEPRDIILSSEENGFLIETVSKRQTYLDANSYKFSDYAEKIEVSNAIYYSRSLDNLEVLLKENGINHIFVDEEMRSGKVWNTREEGILLVLENSKSFVKIFDNKQVQIYRYVGSELKK